MKQRPLIELPLAFALKRLMAPERPPRRARPARRDNPRPAREPAAAEPAAPPARGPLALLALTALIAGGALLIAFDAWLGRLLGVLALSTFIVAGVFAIATPALMDQDRKDR